MKSQRPCSQVNKCYLCPVELFFFSSAEETNVVLSDPGVFFSIKNTITFRTRVWSLATEHQVLLLNGF